MSLDPLENDEPKKAKVGRPRNELSPVHMDNGPSVFDELDPRSVVNIVPDQIRVAILRVGQTKRHLFNQDERILKAKIRPDAITSRLRISFWDEYTRAQDNCTDMVQRNIVKGACSVDYFEKAILTDDRKLAWIISPPKDYTLAMRELLEIGIDEWREILNMPNKSKKGVIDYKLISQKIKIVQMLDLRVKGAIVQRLQVQNKSLNVNVDATSQKPALIDPSVLSLEELLDLESRLDRVKALAPAVDSVVMAEGGKTFSINDLHGVEDTEVVTVPRGY